MFTRESASQGAWGRAMRAAVGWVSPVVVGVGVLGVCGSVLAQGDGPTTRDLGVEQAVVCLLPVSTSVPAQGRPPVTAWVDHADTHERSRQVSQATVGYVVTR